MSDEKATPKDMLEAVQTAVRVGPDRGGITLSEWEESFVGSISKLITNKRTLSQRQLATLEKLYDRT